MKKKKTKRAPSSEELDVSVEIPEVLPVLPTKDLVAFPGVVLSLFIGREPSLQAIEQSASFGGLIFVAAQKGEEEDPDPKDLYKIGTVAQVIKTLAGPDDRTKVLIQGLVRAKVKTLTKKKGAFVAKIAIISPPDKVSFTPEAKKAFKRIRENLQALVEREQLPEEMLLVTDQIDDPGILADVIVAHYKLEPQYAQSLLEELDPVKRLIITDSLIQDDLGKFIVSENIRDKARDEMTKGQREFFLREQIKQIQMELGEADTGGEELVALKKSLEDRKLPKNAKEEATKQFIRLEKMHPETSEYALLRTYLEWISDLPWNVRTKDKLDIKTARKILDQDHFGLDKAKLRILEYLSVRKLKKDSKGPILCFVGPPGVGKTSLGRSISEALGRKFFRMSLGGIRDEAEIRGHRRTYVGALPGRIVQGIKQAGSMNPVFVLDELDKVGADFRGDPASALLEVLDPAQNREFRDHYLNIEFDLSEVLFIATANTVDTIPEALLDRLEVIFIAGYTTEEKVNILNKFLIPRQLKENGLDINGFTLAEDAMLYLIERYTREAGVRNLEREFASLCRKVALEKSEGKKTPSKISVEELKRLLGPTKFDPETTETRAAVGLARGLAWTVHGGEMMPVEVSVAKGKGDLQLTGQLGSIMQESAQAALFYARANTQALGLDPDFHEKFDIHIHAPGGATPKDGPSAGITIAAALVSALSQRRLASDIAMTGEMTLRGNVLPVGGLKEKALAALRYGIKRVIIPFENVKDLEEIPKEQRDKLEFIPVKHIVDVFRLVFKDAPKPQKKSPKMKTPVRKPQARVRV